MLLTEAEARCKMCPEGAANYSFSMNNNGGGAYAGAACAGMFPSCQASNCMAWRWGDDIKQHGYCGKAGKPDGGR